MLKNKKMVRVGVALVALLVAFAMTITATYAWFVMSSNPKIGTFNINLVSGGEILEISIDQSAEKASDAVQWRTEISAAEITAFLFTDGNTLGQMAKPLLEDGFRLGATTTTNGIDVTYEEGLQPLANTGADPDRNGQGGYVEFTIHFRGQQELDVKLGSNTKAATLSGTDTVKPVRPWADNIAVADYGAGRNATGVATIWSRNDLIYTSAAYATRYSFADWSVTGYQAYKDALNEYKAAYWEYMNEFIAWLATPAFNTDENINDAAGKTAFEADTTNKDTDLKWEDVQDLGTALSTVTYTNKAKVWIPETANESLIDMRLNLNTANYYVMTNKANAAGIKVFSNDYRDNLLGRAITAPTTIPNFFDGITTGWRDTAYGQTLITLAQNGGAQPTDYYYGSFDFRIWIEGWDANCSNQILDDTIATTLEFLGVAV